MRTFTDKDRELFRKEVWETLISENPYKNDRSKRYRESAVQYPWYLRTQGCWLTKLEADLVVEFFERDAEQWIEWLDDHCDEDAWESEGEAWKLGGSVWRLRDIPSQAQRDAVTWSEREHDNRSFPTLDEWLAADIRGELEYRGDKGGDARVKQNSPDSHYKFIVTYVHRIGRRRVCPCGAVYHQRASNNNNCPACGKLRGAQRRKRQEQRAGIDEHYPFEPRPARGKDAKDTTSPA